MVSQNSPTASGKLTPALPPPPAHGRGHLAIHQEGCSPKPKPCEGSASPTMDQYPQGRCQHLNIFTGQSITSPSPLASPSLPCPLHRPGVCVHGLLTSHHPPSHRGSIYRCKILFLKKIFLISEGNRNTYNERIDQLPPTENGSMTTWLLG